MESAGGRLWDGFVCLADSQNGGIEGYDILMLWLSLESEE